MSNGGWGRPYGGWGRWGGGSGGYGIYSGGSGYLSAGYADAPQAMMVAPVLATSSPIPDSITSEEAATDETDDGGVRLVEVAQGAAADAAGLRSGDVILSFGGVRTHNFEELRDAVQQANGPVKVVFINGENGQTEYLNVEPEEGRIGVTCE